MESDNQNAEKKAPDAVEGTPAGRDLLVIPRETGVPSTPDSKWIVSVDIGAPDPFDGGCAADAGGHTPPVEMPTFKRLDTTMRPMPDTVGKAIERAKDKIDYDAADIGVAAVVLAQGINPGGSKAGRERLVDAVTAAEKSTPLEAFREGYAMGYSHAFHEAEVEGSLNRIVEMASEIRAKLTAGQPKACGT